MSYKVVWQIRVQTVVIGAMAKEEAEEYICNCDPFDGEYVEDSFEIIAVEKVE